MRILADTNVVVPLVQQNHPLHDLVSAAARTIIERDHQICLVPQVLYEYWVTATRPLSANGFGMETADALQMVDALLTSFSLLRDERAIFDRWKNLVGQHRVMGKNAHDARLVAAMLRHGVTHLLTFNIADFARYPIELLSPREVADRPDSTPPAQAN